MTKEKKVSRDFKQANNPNSQPDSNNNRPYYKTGDDYNEPDETAARDKKAPRTATPKKQGS